MLLDDFGLLKRGEGLAKTMYRALARRPGHTEICIGLNFVMV